MEGVAHPLFSDGTCPPLPPQRPTWFPAPPAMSVQWYKLILCSGFATWSTACVSMIPLKSPALNRPAETHEKHIPCGDRGPGEKSHWMSPAVWVLDIWKLMFRSSPRLVQWHWPSKSEQTQLLDLLHRIATPNRLKELNYNKCETNFSLILSPFCISAEGEGSCQKVN